MQYTEEQKEKRRERQKRFYDNNKEKLSEKARRYYEENKEKLQEKGKKYRENITEEQKEKRRESQKKYRSREDVREKVRIREKAKREETLLNLLKPKPTCPCGGRHTTDPINMYHHSTTKMHQSWLRSAEGQSKLHTLEKVLSVLR